MFKMSEIFLRFFKWLNLFLLIIVASGNNDVYHPHKNVANLNLFDFEQIKNDFFLQSDFNISCIDRRFGNKHIRKHLKCLKQMLEIQRGLRKFDSWAMKIVDAWGKIPSGIFSGNLWEFGDFSECLNIQRDGITYNTQYCFGQIEFGLENNMNPFSKFGQFDMDKIQIPGVWQLQKRNNFEQRMILIPSNNKAALTFGMCLPDACSPHLLEPFINSVILKNSSKIAVKFLNATCQFEETPSLLNNIDVIAICVLMILFSLIIVSTTYDILFTVKNLVKTEVFLIFSLYSNGLKLLSYKRTRSPDMIHCLHGIRVISTAWVVLGHTFVMFALLPTRNKLDLIPFTQQYHNMVILSAFISVDSFFFMSGLLVAINLLKHLEKTNGRINVPLLYFHRYLRLTPLVGIPILCMSLMRFLGSGPLYSTLLDYQISNCETYWWSALLYIQNYVNPDKICLVNTWYLSVDMQLFLIAPAVVYLIYKWKIKAMPILSLLILACIGCTVTVHIKYNLKRLQENKMELAYVPTHIRFSPWLIGVMAGYAIFEARKRSTRIPKMFNLFAWITSLAIMVAVIFSNYPLQQLNSTAQPFQYGLYDALSRVGWAISLSYIVFACIFNYGGPIDGFLSHPLWQPLSRLSYSIYIVHFFIISLTMATIKTVPYFSELNTFHVFIGNFVLTVFVSILASLAFESPFVVIEKLLFQ